MEKSKYSIERRLLRLTHVREVQSKIHGPSIWWIPSIYEYMLRVVEVRLVKMGMKPWLNPGKPGMDFYGESSDDKWVGGFCTNILDKEGLIKEIKEINNKNITTHLIMTESPPTWTIKDVGIWTLTENPTSENISMIPVESRIAERLKDMDVDKDYTKVCTRIVKRGIEAKRWGF